MVGRIDRPFVHRIVHWPDGLAGLLRSSAMMTMVSSSIQSEKYLCFIAIDPENRADHPSIEDRVLIRG